MFKNSQTVDSFSDLVAEGGTISRPSSPPKEGGFNKPITIRHEENRSSHLTSSSIADNSNNQEENKLAFKLNKKISPAVAQSVFGAPASHSKVVPHTSSQSDSQSSSLTASLTSPYLRPSKEKISYTPHLELGSTVTSETKKVLEEFKNAQNPLKYTRQHSRYDAMTEQEAKKVLEEFKNAQNPLEYTRQHSRCDAMTEQEAKKVLEEFKNAQTQTQDISLRSKDATKKETEKTKYLREHSSASQSRLSESTLFTMPQHTESDQEAKETKQKQKTSRLATAGW